MLVWGCWGNVGGGVVVVGSENPNASYELGPWANSL